MCNIAGAMELTVLYFAVARDRAGGRSSEALTLPAAATVADLRAAVEAQHPPLAPLLPRCRVAVNADFAPDSAALSPGDEVAIIPPVSGG